MELNNIYKKNALFTPSSAFFSVISLAKLLDSIDDKLYKDNKGLFHTYEQTILKIDIF